MIGNGCEGSLAGLKKQRFQEVRAVFVDFEKEEGIFVNFGIFE